MGEYNQPEKNQARWLALCHAVESLTTYRDTSPVVTLDHFRRGMKYVCDTLEKTTCFPNPHGQVREKAEAFAELHATRIGKRKANELQVLFLSGPEPMNDLEVMFELGIRPENVWAVESEEKVFQKAVDSLLVSGYGIKIYQGSLQQFFEIVPQQFDIVYFDACGTVMKPKSRTLDVLRQLFERQRLTPLGVLISNFSQANPDDKSLDEWTKRLGSWFFSRDGWEGESLDAYWKHVAENLENYYSNFVSHFVIELAGLLMPWWRVAALDGARQEYFSPAYAGGINLEKFHAERRKMEASLGEVFFEDSFPVYRRVAEVVQESLANDDPLRMFFCADPFKKARLSDAVWLAYAFRNCGDPDFSAISKLNKAACSDAAVKALNSFRWVDQGSQLFCDEPQPHLLADLLLGLYGYPYHCNVAKQRRWRYVASGKVTPMYMDVFVFDQARYFYDLVPTLPLLADGLKFPDQWVLRVCMDSIFRHTAEVCREWFFASTLAETGVEGFQFHTLPKRGSIVAEAE
jgi:hypothetical protein